MPKQLKQLSRPTDVNQLAHQLVEQSTNKSESTVPLSVSEYMANIGRKGGLVGGKRRMKCMTQDERTKIARKAAKTRWKKVRVAKKDA